MRRQAGSLLDRILLTEYMDLIKFLDCWGCDEPLLEDNSRLRLSVSLIHACVSRTLNPLDIFVLGAEMDERNVCATAISAGCFADRVYDAATGEYRQVVWGVKQLPERFLQLCSAEYVDASSGPSATSGRSAALLPVGATFPSTTSRIVSAHSRSTKTLRSEASGGVRTWAFGSATTGDEISVHLGRLITIYCPFQSLNSANV